MAEEPKESSQDETIKSDKVAQCYSDFQKLVEERKEQGCPAAIFSHTCPDPDAIASMMGMQWLLQRAFDLDSTLYYAGEVSHPQNGAVVNLLSRRS